MTAGGWQAEAMTLARLPSSPDRPTMECLATYLLPLQHELGQPPGAPRGTVVEAGSPMDHKQSRTRAIAAAPNEQATQFRGCVTVLDGTAAVSWI